MGSSALRWSRVEAIKGMQRESGLRSGRKAGSGNESAEKDERWLKLLTTLRAVSMQKEEGTLVVVLEVFVGERDVIEVCVWKGVASKKDGAPTSAAWCWEKNG